MTPLEENAAIKVLRLNKGRSEGEDWGKKIVIQPQFSGLRDGGSEKSREKPGLRNL